MARKGFATPAEVRGLLPVPADTDQEAYERVSYVAALPAANMTLPSDWTNTPRRGSRACGHDALHGPVDAATRQNAGRARRARRAGQVLSAERLAQAASAARA
jgi:hypothetical protein